MLRSFRAMCALNYLAPRYCKVRGQRLNIYRPHTEPFIQPRSCFGDGLQTMDVLHTVGICRVNLPATSGAMDEGIYILASGCEISLKGSAETPEDPTGAGVNVQCGPARLVHRVTLRLSFNEASAQRVSFAAAASFTERLRQLVNWWHLHCILEGVPVGVRG
jgi:hypothetical protein